MKQFFLSATFLLFLNLGSYINAQNLIINGGFEINNLSTSETDIEESYVFDSLISGVFLIEGTLCLLTDDASPCVAPAQGNWMIADDNDYYWGAFGFVLSQDLFAGHTYELKFFDQSCIGNYGQRSIDIALSNNPDQIGDVVASITNGFDSIWTSRDIIFTPTEDKTFLTIKLLEEYAGFNAGLHADDFSLTEVVTGISNVSSSFLSLFPNPATATITLQLPISKPSTITIINIVGEEVIRESISTPIHSVSFNISNLLAGTYFIVVGNEDETLCGKFGKQ